MRHEKRVWPEYFRAMLNGRKNFELRLADFRCKPNDTLILREWDPKTQKYTGRILKKKATYILKTKNLKFWTKREIAKHGFQIIAFR